MNRSKARNITAVVVGVILLCGATFMLLKVRARSAKYHLLVVHAYSRGHVSDPTYEAVLDDLRANTWPKERKLAEETIAARQRADGAVSASTIDLKRYINAALTDSPASGAGNTGNNLADLSPGVNVYGGVPFDVEGLVQLSGKNLISIFHKDFPVEVDGIDIHQHCSKIYLLHAAHWIDVPDFGKIVARLVLHYQDGSRRQIDIVAGRDVFNFWSPLFTTGVDPRYSRMSTNTVWAWTGSNRYLEQLWPDESLILYRSTFTNPQSDLMISTVDYVSTMTATAPFMVGLSVE